MVANGGGSSTLFQPGGEWLNGADPRVLFRVTLWLILGKTQRLTTCNDGGSWLDGADPRVFFFFFLMWLVNINLPTNGG